MALLESAAFLVKGSEIEVVVQGHSLRRHWRAAAPDGPMMLTASIQMYQQRLGGGAIVEGSFVLGTFWQQLSTFPDRLVLGEHLRYPCLMPGSDRCPNPQSLVCTLVV